ncbi:MAG: dihydroorotase [Erysipelotrichaceae bacterium]|nr:dihydroorotase [Erysipelotrichaceae bacterium]
MIRLFKDGKLFYKNRFQDLDFLIDDEGRIVIADAIELDDNDVDEVIDCRGIHIMPGFIDPHVHLRQPGFEYKETIKTGTTAAAHGGVTTVFAMPNLNPVPDSLENLAIQQDAIDKDAVVKVYPICAITKGQKSRSEVGDIDTLSQACFLYSNDGVGVQDEETMRQAMKLVEKNDGVIIAHCEDEDELLPGGCVHMGKKDKEYGLVGINSASEYKQVQRDLKLVEETGCQYHICHMSTKESVEALREAKKKGLPVSGEVTVHHLLLCEDDITENHGRFKMNPPLRSKEDQEALIRGIQDGTIEMIATDQAPHSEEEKNCTMDKAKMGIVSIERSFALVYTYLVRKGIITLEQAVRLMSCNAAEIFRIPGGEIVNFEKCDLAFFHLNTNEKINASKFVSKGKSTPFDKMYVQAKCVMTIVDGKIVFRRDI